MSLKMPEKRSLDQSEWCDFLVLVDPERGLPEVLHEAGLQRLLAVAEEHGLSAIVLRKISEDAGLKKRLPGAIAMLDHLNDAAVLSMGLTMMLEHYYLMLQERIVVSGLRVVVVKGPVFARNLYRNVNDRPYTDIDLLAHPEDMIDASRILTDLGFSRFKKDLWDRSDVYQEQKWLHAGNPNIMIELHGNLVHYPSLRRRVSFGYDDFSKACQSEGDCPIALFMTTVVHASLGHKFHKLQLLVDILQAFRHLSDEQVALLSSVAAQLSLRLEVALCLDSIAGVFGDQRAAKIAKKMALPVQSALARALVSPQALLETHGQSRFRRHAFRWLQSLHLSR